VWIVHGILCTATAQPPRFCLDILERKPRILGQLFDCAVLDRPPWYPETRVPDIASETLTLLFRWPNYVIPGIDGPADKVFKAQDWKTMTQTMAILTSRPDWVEKLVEVHMHIQEEDLRKTRMWALHTISYGRFADFVPSSRHWQRVGRDYGAIVPPDDDAFDRVFESRGRLFHYSSGSHTLAHI